MRRLVGAVVTVLVLAAGCSDDDGGTPASDVLTLTREDGTTARLPELVASCAAAVDGDGVTIVVANAGGPGADEPAMLLQVALDVAVAGEAVDLPLDAPAGQAGYLRLDLYDGDNAASSVGRDASGTVTVSTDGDSCAPGDVVTVDVDASLATTEFGDVAESIELAGSVEVEVGELDPLG